MASTFCKTPPRGVHLESAGRDASNEPGNPTRSRLSLPTPRPATGDLHVECAELLDQLADFLDEDARADLCREIDEHLRRCPSCQVYVDTIRKTIVLYQ